MPNETSDELDGLLRAVAAAPSGPILHPGQVLGRYVVGERIGQGGMGAVFVATQAPLGRTVALKVIRPDRVDADALERFRREAEILGSLSHPHIATLLDFGVLDDGSAFYAMEKLSGRDLRTALAQGPLSASNAVAIARDVASALAAIHARGILHRDLKPANIFLVDDAGRTPFARVLDFGVAKRGPRPSGTIENPLTAADAMVGTPGYIAPEIVSRGQLEASSDIYALGVVMFEMLVGAPPFAATTPMGLLLQHATAALPDMRALRPGIDPRIAALAARLLHKDPAARPDAHALVRTLDEALASGRLSDDAPTNSAVPTVELPRSPPQAQRRKRTAAAIAAIIIVAGVCAGVATVALPEWRRHRAVAEVRALDDDGDLERDCLVASPDPSRCVTQSLAVALSGDRGFHSTEAVLNRLCLDGNSVHACFVLKVLEATGVGSSANPFGAVELSAAERSAGDTACHATHARADCYLLSILEERELRAAGRTAEARTLRASWSPEFCELYHDACGRQRVVEEQLDALR